MKPPHPPQRTSSTVARVYRCLAAVIFLGSGTLAMGCSLLAPHSPELIQACELDASYDEEIQYVHAHVLKVVRAHYRTAVSDKPGHVQTDYEPLRQQPTDENTRHLAQVTVSLRRSSENLQSYVRAYKVNIDASAQLEKRTSSGWVQSPIPNPPWLRAHLHALRQQIHQRMHDIAYNCKGVFRGRRSCGATPKGTPADLRMPIRLPEGISVSLPKVCEKGGYIRVSRQRPASRTSATKRPDSSVKKREESPKGCFDLTDEPKKLRDCPVMDVQAPLMDASARARAAGIRVNGVGLGSCGTTGDYYDSWNMSFGVLKWRDAGQAIQILAEALEEWDFVGYAGVSVKGIGCAVLL